MQAVTLTLMRTAIRSSLTKEANDMRYVLAMAEKAELVGFDRETHNLVGVNGSDNMMVITAKGMMSCAKLTGDEKQRLKQLGGIAFENQRELETYLRNFNIK